MCDHCDVTKAVLSSLPNITRHLDQWTLSCIVDKACGCGFQVVCPCRSSADYSLETERVDTRQNSRVGEHLDGTLRHIIQFLTSWWLTSHIFLRIRAAGYMWPVIGTMLCYHYVFLPLFLTTGQWWQTSQFIGPKSMLLQWAYLQGLAPAPHLWRCKKVVLILVWKFLILKFEHLKMYTWNVRTGTPRFKISKYSHKRL